MEQSPHQLPKAEKGLSKMILEVIQVAAWRGINVSALIIRPLSFPSIREATLSSSPAAPAAAASPRRRHVSRVQKVGDEREEPFPLLHNAHFKWHGAVKVQLGGCWSYLLRCVVFVFSHEEALHGCRTTHALESISSIQLAVLFIYFKIKPATAQTQSNYGNGLIARRCPLCVCRGGHRIVRWCTEYWFWQR